MEKQNSTGANVVKPKSTRGNSFAYSGAEVIVQPQYTSRTIFSASEVRNKDTSKDVTFLSRSEPKRTLSGKQIAYLLDLDQSKRKEAPKDTDKATEKLIPRKKYHRAPSVAEMLKSKRLEISSASVHRTETVLPSFSSNRTVTMKKIHRSPGAKVIEQQPHRVINIDDDGISTAKEASLISKPIEIGTDESDSSDDEFLKSFGTKRKTKRTAKDLDHVEAITIDSTENKHIEKAQGKPIRISIDSPIHADWAESEEPKRKTKKLKTQSDCIEITEVTNVKKELRLSYSKSPEKLLGDAAPTSAPGERQTSDSQNDLMELGFTKREHGDSQRDSQHDSQGSTLQGSNVDKRNESIDLTKNTSLLTRPVGVKHLEPPKQGESAKPVQEKEHVGKQDAKAVKVTDVKLLQQMKTQSVGTSGIIDPAALAKNIPPQYVMVIKPNIESMKAAADSDLKLRDNAIKIVQRKELHPHRVISVPVGSEKLKVSEPSVGKPEPSALPPGMITVSRAGQATAITIPQPIQILSTLAGQMSGLPSPIPVVPSVIPPVPKIKVMTSASLSASSAPAAVTASTSVQSIKPPIQATNLPASNAPGIQKARVINVSSGTVSVGPDIASKLTYARQFQAVHRALPGIMKVQPVAVMQKPVVSGTKPQEMTTVHPVFTTTTKPVAPEPISLASQRLVRIMLQFN